MIHIKFILYDFVRLILYDFQNYVQTILKAKQLKTITLLVSK